MKYLIEGRFYTEKELQEKKADYTGNIYHKVKHAWQNGGPKIKKAIIKAIKDEEFEEGMISDYVGVAKDVAKDAVKNQGIPMLKDYAGLGKNPQKYTPEEDRLKHGEENFDEEDILSPERYRSVRKGFDRKDNFRRAAIAGGVGLAGYGAYKLYKNRKARKGRKEDFDEQDEMNPDQETPKKLPNYYYKITGDPNPNAEEEDEDEMEEISLGTPQMKSGGGRLSTSLSTPSSSGSSGHKAGGGYLPGSKYYNPLA